MGFMKQLQLEEIEKAEKPLGKRCSFCGVELSKANIVRGDVEENMCAHCDHVLSKDD